MQAAYEDWSPWGVFPMPARDNHNESPFPGAVCSLAEFAREAISSWQLQPKALFLTI
jgi:hypothetical protein